MSVDGSTTSEPNARNDSGQEPVRQSSSAATRRLLEQRVEYVLELLSPRERQVIELRFGLTDGRGYTRRLVGEIVGVRIEWVGQIETRAIEKLRRRER